MANHPALTVKLWGTRGSIPATVYPTVQEKLVRDLFGRFFGQKNCGKSDLEDYLQKLPRHLFGGYGGNTSCAEVKSKTTRLVIDAGSGIRHLGYELLGGDCGKGTGEVHLLMTHFHWDHILGLPFFVPIFIPGNTIHVYAVQNELEDVFRSVFKKPCFPVAYEMLASKIVYHQLEPRKPVTIGDITVTPYQLDHPDPCWGYRFEKEGRVYSHCVDTEGKRVTREELGLDLPLYQNVDVMVYDAQYTVMETLEKVNWGHAAATIGLDIAMREGIKKVVFIHHDPASTNEKIAAAEIQARRYYEEQLKDSHEANPPLQKVDWSFGYDGIVIEI